MVDKNSIRYNPTGPGDYNLPSIFGVAAIYTANGSKPKLKMGAKLPDKAVQKSHPAFSMAQRLN